MIILLIAGYFHPGFIGFNGIIGATERFVEFTEVIIGAYVTAMVVYQVFVKRNSFVKIFL